MKSLLDKIYDITIVGAGPAGSFLAHKLKNTGLRVLILEKQKYLRRKVCGEYLCPLGVRILSSDPEAQTVLDGLPKLFGMVIRTAKGTSVDTNFPESEKNHGVSVNRWSFDSRLLELARQSGSEIQMGVDVQGMQQIGQHWKIVTSEGNIITRMVIGADGRNSVVSKSVKNDLSVTQRRVALHYFADNPFHNNIRKGEMHLLKDGAYVGINPIDASEINVSLVMDAEKLKSLGGPHSALRHYFSQSPDLARRFLPLSDETKIHATFPIQHRTKAVVPVRHIALIGDAAGFVDPLTGEGMFYALMSADILATSIKKHLSAHLRLNQSALEDYQAVYRKLLWQKVLLNTGFQWLIRRPKLIEVIAQFLLAQRKRADTFIGIIGNIYTPLTGIRKLLTF